MQCYWLMMKIKNTLCLHILMATLAILFLCVHPLVTSFNPPLTFQPLIKSMAARLKNKRKKLRLFPMP
ncbi:poly(glycerophosphate chain) D-alanine transfer protein [Enterobacter asburiae]|uniref:Poly(Glycerophosphate chain) D-alanine transfer protein n=1 Tax=Enterobacter asburiae TaxID=61645 RepID=A0A376F6Y8_ENTAS|nr:poly(glycerophosphate chain) D-alanine transfer protein [Enterobacter asburiae]